jgi:hypothetical protein
MSKGQTREHETHDCALVYAKSDIEEVAEGEMGYITEDRERLRNREASLPRTGGANPQYLLELFGGKSNRQHAWGGCGNSGFM